MAAPLRIAVVGSGAIGTYYGGKLAAGGADVRFLVRSDLSAVQRQGFRIRGPDEDVRLSPVNCYGATREIGPCDLVLIAIKATANASLLDLIPPLLHDGTLLLTLQNGLGNEDFLASHFGPDRVLAGLCFICLRRTSPGVIERYDHGHITIGEFERKPRQRTYDIVAEFQRCGIQCGAVENLALERWRKLVWNIPFNGLSILAGGIDTATILADENLRQATVELMEEVIAAANKCGFPLEDSAVQEQMKRTATMGHYKPSTLLDFEAGKELELEPIWGEPFRRALAAGATVPRLHLLYSLLRSVDEVRRAKADDRHK
ncbi:MAG: 2-dehydropantoate 2-reductase [Verrucomicrobiota bacterium]|jgi:2-dehydropantoate 2-reductase